jgi:hypothetical protein
MHLTQKIYAEQQTKNKEQLLLKNVGEIDLIFNATFSYSTPFSTKKGRNKKDEH